MTQPPASNAEPEAAPLAGPAHGSTALAPPTSPGPRTSAVVVLDPGHNGANGDHPEIINSLVPAGFGASKPCNTTGTASPDGYSEHAFSFDVALRVKRLLTVRGVTVLLTREDDSGVGPCVDRRAAFGNAHQADAVVSIHADGHPGGRGFHVIEAARPPAGKASATASHRLAVAVHDRFAAESGFATSTYVGSGGYAPRADLAGLNLSTQPAIFIECGNMWDAEDAARMAAASGRERMAGGIATGILDFLAGS